MARGGMVPGRPGGNYPNRSDLTRQPSVPARVATGQTYGKAQQQIQAMRTVPMRPPPATPAPPPGGQPQPVGGGGAPPSGGAPMPPGGFGPLARPTERPGEPVTTGAPVGPGAGPETLPQGPSNPMLNSNLSQILQHAAQATGSSAVAELAQRAALAGQ